MKKALPFLFTSVVFFCLGVVFSTSAQEAGDDFFDLPTDDGIIMIDKAEDINVPADDAFTVESAKNTDEQSVEGGQPDSSETDVKKGESTMNPDNAAAQGDAAVPPEVADAPAEKTTQSENVTDTAVTDDGREQQHESDPQALFDDLMNGVTGLPAVKAESGAPVEGPVQSPEAVIASPAVPKTGPSNMLLLVLSAVAALVFLGFRKLFGRLSE